MGWTALTPIMARQQNLLPTGDNRIRPKEIYVRRDTRSVRVTGQWSLGQVRPRVTSTDPASHSNASFL